MHTTHLRKVGGSIMLAVPTAVLNVLNLHAGDSVNLTVEAGHILIEPNLVCHYSLSELLAMSDYKQAHIIEEQEWVNDLPIGRELI